MEKNGKGKLFSGKSEWSKEDGWLFESGSHTSLFGGSDWFSGEAKEGRELNEYVQGISNALRLSLELALNELTPWFFSNMPQYYYETTPRDEKIRDLRAIITGQILEQKQKLQLWNLKRTKTTFLASGENDTMLMEIAQQIKSLNIKNGTTLKSKDNQLLIASFNTDEFTPVNQSEPLIAAKFDQAKKILEDEADTTDVQDFLDHLDHDLVVHSTAPRLARLYILSHLLESQEDTITHLIPRFHKGLARFDIAYKNMPINETLSSLFQIITRYGFVAQRCIASLVNQHKESPVTVFTFIVEHISGKKITEKFVPFLKANKAAKTLKWLDSDEYDQFIKTPLDPEKDPPSLNEVNLVRSMATWTHIFLSKKDPYRYSKERIFSTFQTHGPLLSNLIHYFRVSFDPRFKGDRNRKLKPLRNRIVTRIQSMEQHIQQDIFEEAFNFIRHTLKTNYFSPHKTGLSFRIDPDCLDPEFYPNKPFGIFYLVGRGYRGFHVRFRDTARGGLRIVMPRESSQYDASLAGVFDEVIGLSYAQQMKNKDIPEGGSKAVLVLSPGADRRNAAIGAVDSILNLITAEKETGKLHPTIIDHYGKDEYIYLGPDENVTNELIDKFISLARNQGYRYANAFMSSKPDAGINHKEYGVTSEGVNVFLDNMLHELKLNPKSERFTVKMTGGPDGDVAGNELKFLHREYGENARVTAVADGFGAAMDPEGLAWEELLRLVREELPISSFRPEYLSGDKEAFVIKADTREHIKTRNNLFAVVEADIFIPAGGRPYTVNDRNWEIFLNDQGKPTARAVVEGANIFFTEKARHELQKRGLLIFKDSSANKCGVICSSFEILASLLLNPDEFIEIKPVYVQQVLKKLRSWADIEAKILLKEYHERGESTNLVDLSKELSKVINRVTDLVATSLEKLSIEEFHVPLYQNIILNYLPGILLEKYGDRVLHDLPESYQKALVSAEIASSIVYREGITWLDMLPDQNIPETIMTYVQKEHRISQLIESLKQGKIESLEEITSILDMTGARALTLMEHIGASN